MESSKSLSNQFISITGYLIKFPIFPLSEINMPDLVQPGMRIPCFLDGSTMLSTIWSLLNTRDPQSPWFLAPFLTPTFALSPPRVKSDPAALLSRFSHWFIPFNFFLIQWDQSRTSHECSISYPICIIDILVNTMCSEFLAWSFVTKLNIGIKHSIHASIIWQLFIWHLMNQHYP